jgi:hypothetical protein
MQEIQEYAKVNGCNKYLLLFAKFNLIYIGNARCMAREKRPDPSTFLQEMA